MCINLCFLLATAKVLWGIDRLCQTSKIAGLSKTAWNCHVRIAGFAKTAWNYHVRIAGLSKTAWNYHVRIAGFAKTAWNYPKFGIILLSLNNLQSKVPLSFLHITHLFASKKPFQNEENKIILQSASGGAIANCTGGQYGNERR